MNNKKPAGKNSDKPKKTKKKKKFSLIRVAIGLLIGIVLMYALLAVDQKMANVPYYQDLVPHWSPDGKTIVFVRWLSFKNGYQSPFELWRVNPDGKNMSMIYESNDGFGCYGIRRLKFSGDSKYMNMRLNRKTGSNGTLVELDDMLVRVPLAKNEKPLEWHLEKKFPYDVFLAFSGEKVLIRRMKEQGDFAPSELLEARFSDRKVLRRITRDSGKQICIMAEYSGKSQELVGIFKTIDKTDKVNGWTCRLYRMNKSPVPLFKAGQKVTYLEKRKVFVEHHPQDPRKLNVRDRNGRLIREIENPTGIRSSNRIHVPESETDVILFKENRVYFINLDNFTVCKMTLPVHQIQNISPSPDGKKLAFSDGSVIYVVDRTGENLHPVTTMSKRTKLLEKPFYRWYIRQRNLIIFGHDH